MGQDYDGIEDDDFLGYCEINAKDLVRKLPVGQESEIDFQLKVFIFPLKP